MLYNDTIINYILQMRIFYIKLTFLLFNNIESIFYLNCQHYLLLLSYYLFYQLHTYHLMILLHWYLWINLFVFLFTNYVHFAPVILKCLTPPWFIFLLLFVVIAFQSDCCFCVFWHVLYYPYLFIFFFEYDYTLTIRNAKCFFGVWIIFF